MQVKFLEKQKLLRLLKQAQAKIEGADTVPADEDLTAVQKLQADLEVDSHKKANLEEDLQMLMERNSRSGELQEGLDCMTIPVSYLGPVLPFKIKSL